MDKPSKVAIFFQLEPGQKIVGEGIAQYIDRVISGYCEMGTQVDIYCPGWAKSQMQNFLTWSSFPPKQVRARYFGSIFLNVFFATRKSARKSDHESLVFEDVKYRPKGLSDLMIDNANLLKIMAVFLPVLIVLGLIFALPLLVLLLVRRLFGARLGSLSRAFLGVFKFLAYADMASAIDRDRKLAVCIVPIGTWSMCRLVRRVPVVAQIPDIVWKEFPAYFPPSQALSNSLREIRKVAFHARAVTCPSQYVRKSHLIDLVGVDREKAFVCLHGPMTVDEKIRQGDGKLPSKEEARVALGEGITRALNLDDGSYARRINFDMRREAQLRTFATDPRPLIYYPTQNRPYKNFETIFRALSRLRSQYGKSVRIMLTADLSISPRLMEEIDRLDLFSEVVLLPRLPQKLHALAYVACDMALSASYFEGGFTFVFSEALSVDRPCLVSDIPASKEVVPADIAGITLFRADSAEALSNLIIATLRDSSGVLRAQSKFQKQRSEARSWRDVARDYWQFGKAG